MDFAEQLRVLEAAQGDPAKLALATVDLAYPALADAESRAPSRNPLKPLPSRTGVIKPSLPPCWGSRRRKAPPGSPACAA